jgi:hypothetical protein
VGNEFILAQFVYKNPNYEWAQPMKSSLAQFVYKNPNYEWLNQNRDIPVQFVIFVNHVLEIF